MKAKVLKIATTAAGSRQQSRFIAMMSDYSRTMELVNAANNSAGSGQAQFEKTLDSLDAKLQKLKNAWDTFTMGLANNTFVKGAVDMLTGLITTVNKVIDGLSGGNGAIKSFLTLVTVLKTLQGGKTLFSWIKDWGKSGSKTPASLVAIVDAFKQINEEGGLVGTVIKGITSGKGGMKALGEAVGGLGTAFKGAGASALGLLKSLGMFAANIAVFIAIAAAVYAIGKAIYDNTTAGKLKQAKEDTQKAGEAAEEAAARYNELNSALESIGDKTSTLDSLTKGTTEWKEAVVELNQQILDLVDKYPELAKFITTENGHLVLDTEGSRPTADGAGTETVEDILNRALEYSVLSQQVYA